MMAVLTYTKRTNQHAADLLVGRERVGRVAVRVTRADIGAALEKMDDDGEVGINAGNINSIEFAQEQDKREAGLV